MITKTKFAIATLGFILIVSYMTSVSSATTVELVNPSSLSSKLNEGDHIDYIIKISDYADAQNVMIETSLVSTNNKPVYDFGELNPSLAENVYNSVIILNTSKLPPGSLQVSVHGKVPEGENTDKFKDIIITKFGNTNLKYYEVMTDKKLIKMEPFELIINRKKTFEDTMEKIERPELSGIKRNVQKLSDKGLVSEAQEMASELENIQWPNSLLLLGMARIDSNLMLNIAIIIMLIIGIVIGFLLGKELEQN